MKIILELSKSKIHTILLGIIKNHFPENETDEELKKRNLGGKPEYLYEIIKHSKSLSKPLKDLPVLDIGCSWGAMLLTMKEIGFEELYGVDSDQFDTSRLQNISTYKSYWGNEKGKLRFSICDVSSQDLPFESDFFSIVLINQVIEHLHNPSKILKEIFRVLKKDGLVLVGTPNVAMLKNRLYLLTGKSNYYPLKEFLDFRIDSKFVGHVREYTLDELSYMVNREGFNVIEKHVFPSEFKRNVPKSKLIYKLYNFIEKIFSNTGYYLLIIGQKRG